MDHMTQMVIRTSLRDMFSKGRVDVCAIRKCLELTGITPVGPELDQLAALHCIYFKDMERELAEAIPGMVAGLFDGLTLNVDDLFKPRPQLGRVVDITPRHSPELGRIRRLLGIK